MQKFEELSGEKWEVFVTYTEPENEPKKIPDMRGEQFSSNFLLIENDKLYYCGIPVKGLDKSLDGLSKFYYYIMANEKDAIAMIALSDEDYQLATKYLQS